MPRQASNCLPAVNHCMTGDTCGLPWYSDCVEPIRVTRKRPMGLKGRLHSPSCHQRETLQRNLRYLKSYRNYNHEYKLNTRPHGPMPKIRGNWYFSPLYHRYGLHVTEGTRPFGSLFNDPFDLDRIRTDITLSVQKQNGSD
jgi:hypothetical protein